MARICQASSSSINTSILNPILEIFGYLTFFCHLGIDWLIAMKRFQLQVDKSVAWSESVKLVVLLIFQRFFSEIR